MDLGAGLGDRSDGCGITGNVPGHVRNHRESRNGLEFLLRDAAPAVTAKATSAVAAARIMRLV